MTCPCCSGRQFEDCCKPFIDKSQIPEAPTELMRSRYTAFFMKNAQYLFDTSSKNLQKSLTVNDLQDSCDACRFVGLEVMNAAEDQVEFVAKILIGDIYTPLHERSTFIKNEYGHWCYDNGEIFDNKEIKLKRNDVCPCGSGKKYKKCHML